MFYYRTYKVKQKNVKLSIFYKYLIRDLLLNRDRTTSSCYNVTHVLYYRVFTLLQKDMKID